MGSETLPSAYYILSDESSIPFYSTSNGYNYESASAEISTVAVYENVLYDSKFLLR